MRFIGERAFIKFSFSRQRCKSLYNLPCPALIDFAEQNVLLVVCRQNADLLMFLQGYRMLGLPPLTCVHVVGPWQQTTRTNQFLLLSNDFLIERKSMLAIAALYSVFFLCE